ncbi:2-phosphosulfolactate phosphatase [Chitinophaga costaii]|uniref:Probable 2-phosphosulfolactate phosphatase n=1 Tax=Chitinophaga costaii TaxID=1335309 RepID=A0A1C4ARQ9_9BACT|nr:2-phosphosulfolactate phosphatase [Chitinophaga costaii]PUZ26722.1 2-phosphosulfolactate phosphatase [Chitinophaga costaii]SCB97370.1 2-phosphosulfolactate phosphatase [Chitinophaga costaii]
MSESIKPRLEVCMSPALLHLYDVKDSIVVIIDVLRATSTICTALYNGAVRVIPVADVAECVRIGQALGAITAGERDGKIADGLQYGNSPFEYPRNFVEGKTLVLTTTNGTKLLHMAKDAKQIITGSFPNLSAVCDYLVAQKQHVLLGCAAWKDRVNMEDTLFAGAVVNRIRDHFTVNCDSALLSESTYLAGKDDLFTFMQGATHFKRLSGFGLEDDIRYCLTPDGANVLPLLVNNELVAYHQ